VKPVTGKEQVMSSTKSRDNKAIVDRSFTEFWGKSWNAYIREERLGDVADMSHARPMALVRLLAKALTDFFAQISDVVPRQSHLDVVHYRSLMPLAVKRLK
jgi:hypothetical protein